MDVRQSLYDRGYRTRPVRIPGELELWTHLKSGEQRIIAGNDKQGWCDVAYPSDGWLD